jgi:integrase
MSEQVTQVTIEEILEKFKQFLEERKRLAKPLERGGPPLTSDYTARHYYICARRFLREVWAMHRGLPIPPPEDTLRQFFAILRKRSKPSTVAKYFFAVKNLYVAMGWSFPLDFRSLLPEGVERFVDQPYLKREEIEKVIQYAEEKAQNGNAIDLRNVVILYLLKYGLRPEDIRRLRVENIMFEKMKEEETGETYEACVIRYTPCKRGRPAVKILNRKASTWLQRWIGCLEAVFGRDIVRFAPIAPSFRAKTPPNIRGREKRLQARLLKPMSRQAIYLIVRQLTLGALRLKAASPYAIRRGIIVSLIESGKRIEDIGRFMAWRNPLMATVYDKRSQLEVSRQFIDI